MVQGEGMVVDDGQAMEAELQRLRRELDRARGELSARTAEVGEKDRQLERYAAELSESIRAERARTHELARSYAATVRALANAVEARNAYTGKHAERVAAYGLEIAGALGLKTGEQPEIEFGFLLHDVGKVAVPDAILFKPGPLAPQEREVVESHPVRGAEILHEITFLGAGRDVVRHHHERWDGAGYPDGLAGKAIPLAARVFAVADVIDALTSDRPYRHAGTFAQARATIIAEAGGQFDPGVVAAYAKVSDEALAAIRDRLG